MKKLVILILMVLTTSISEPASLSIQIKKTELMGKQIFVAGQQVTFVRPIDKRFGFLKVVPSPDRKRFCLLFQNVAKEARIPLSMPNQPYGALALLDSSGHNFRFVVFLPDILPTDAWWINDQTIGYASFQISAGKWIKNPNRQQSIMTKGVIPPEQAAFETVSRKIQSDKKFAVMKILNISKSEAGENVEATIEVTVAKSIRNLVYTFWLTSDGKKIKEISWEGDLRP